MLRQQRLEKEYIEVADRTMERDYFIDFTICDICSSKNLHYKQGQNGIKRNCLDCDKFFKENYSKTGEYIG